MDFKNIEPNMIMFTIINSLTNDKYSCHLNPKFPLYELYDEVCDYLEIDDYNFNLICNGKVVENAKELTIEDRFKNEQRYSLYIFPKQKTGLWDDEDLVDEVDQKRMKEFIFEEIKKKLKKRQKIQDTLDCKIEFKYVENIQERIQQNTNTHNKMSEILAKLKKN